MFEYTLCVASRDSKDALNSCLSTCDVDIICISRVAVGADTTNAVVLSENFRLSGYRTSLFAVIVTESSLT